VRRFRAYYGAAPLHLLAIIASFVIVAAAIVNLFHARTHIGNILLWYLGCLLAIEFVLVPLLWALDRIASGPGVRGSSRPRCGGGWVYVRVPALLSSLLLLVFLPLIVRLGDSTFRGTTGMAPSDGYLVRWLLASAVMFACSGLLYAARLARTRRAKRTQTRREHPRTLGHNKGLMP
jgi:hypothetical protein